MSFGMFAQNSILSYSDQNPNSIPIYPYHQEYEQSNSGGVIGGYQTAARVENIFMNLVIAISSSIVTIVGMFYGAKRIDLIKYIINYALKWSLFMSIAATATFFIFSESILRIFTDDLKTINEGVNYFYICSFSLPFVAIGMLTCRAMQGLDKPSPFLVITVLRVILISIPMAWVGVKYFNYEVNWVWWSILASSVITSIMSIFWMYKVIKDCEKSITKI